MSVNAVPTMVSLPGVPRMSATLGLHVAKPGLAAPRRGGRPATVVIDGLRTARFNSGIIGDTGSGSCASMEPSDDRRPDRATAAPFRFDVASGTLWQGTRRLPVRARTAAVLRHLLERRGEVVGRDELRQVVWGRRHGSEHGPKQCVRELRSLLSDSADAPRYIETVGQSGYRLIGDIDLVAGAGQGRGDSMPGRFASGQTLCVGRERELQEMDASLASARRGERPISFVAGEPGIGKTTLIDAFLARLGGRRDLWSARGQCMPHDGPGEAYGPLLTVAERIAGTHMRTLFVDLVRRLAPRLLTQMPAVFDRREIMERQVEVAGGGPEQALRQLIHVFERLSRELPGVLVIEDAHWADSSSCNWVAAWALQQAPANLLLIVSYRPGGMTTPGHPAQRMLAEVRRAPGCRAIELSGLTTDALARYLDIQFPDNEFSRDLASVLQDRTEGHALFVAAMVQDWLARGILVQHPGRWELTEAPGELSVGIPADLRELIDRQLSQRSNAERHLLELASAAGLEFSGRRPGRVGERHRCDRAAMRNPGRPPASAAAIRTRALAGWHGGVRLLVSAMRSIATPSTRPCRRTLGANCICGSASASNRATPSMRAGSR